MERTQAFPRSGAGAAEVDGRRRASRDRRALNASHAASASPSESSSSSREMVPYVVRRRPRRGWETAIGNVGGARAPPTRVGFSSPPPALPARRHRRGTCGRASPSRAHVRAHSHRPAAAVANRAAPDSPPHVARASAPRSLRRRVPAYLDGRRSARRRRPSPNRRPPANGGHYSPSRSGGEELPPCRRRAASRLGASSSPPHGRRKHLALERRARLASCLREAEAPRTPRDAAARLSPRVHRSERATGAPAGDAAVTSAVSRRRARRACASAAARRARDALGARTRRRAFARRIKKNQLPDLRVGRHARARGCRPTRTSPKRTHGRSARTRPPMGASACTRRARPLEPRSAPTEGGVGVPAPAIAPRRARRRTAPGGEGGGTRAEGVRPCRNAEEGGDQPSARRRRKRAASSASRAGGVGASRDEPRTDLRLHILRRGGAHLHAQNCGAAARRRSWRARARRRRPFVG